MIQSESVLAIVSSRVEPGMVRFVRKLVQQIKPTDAVASFGIE